MTILATTIERLTQAHDDVTALMLTRNVIEGQHGEDSDAMAEFEEGQLQPAIMAVAELEAKLAAIPARTQTALMDKIAALCVEGMQDSIFQAIRADLDAYQAAPADPAVKICQRFLVVHRERQRLYLDGPKGNFEGPAMDEIDRVYWELVDEVAAVTPTTAEGVALLSKVNLIYSGAVCLIGTEGWAQEIQAPEYLLMQRLCEGAARVANGKP